MGVSETEIKNTGFIKRYKHEYFPNTDPDLNHFTVAMLYSVVAMVVLATMVTVCSHMLPSNRKHIRDETHSDRPDAKSMDHNGMRPGHDSHNEIDGNMDTCAQLNQVQSVVIQLLGSHYENRKTMDILTSLSDSVQQDILDIKTRVDSLDTTQFDMDERIKELASNQRNVTQMLASMNDTSTSNTSLESSNAHKQSATQGKSLRSNSLESPSQQYAEAKIANLSKAMDRQAQTILGFERQTRRLRRSISRAEQKLEQVVSARENATAEGAMVRHFMEKQKEINGDMLGRIRYLEEHLKQMLQQDSPHMQNNGCPRDFVRHFMSCYRFLNTTLNWIDAEKHCQALHLRSHLIGLETPEEEQFIIQFRNYNNAPWTSMYVWTGATDMGKESVWTWVGTSQPLRYTNWRPGQPDNHNHNWQNCIYVRTHGHDNQWDDWHCHAARINFVCEINLQA